jgi:hypothetical protein
LNSNKKAGGKDCHVMGVQPISVSVRYCYCMFSLATVTQLYRILVKIKCFISQFVVNEFLPRLYKGQAYDVTTGSVQLTAPANRGTQNGTSDF